MRSVLGGYLFDLRMVAQVGSLFLLSLAITTVASVIRARSGAAAAAVGLDPGLAESAGGAVAQTLSFVVPYVLTVGMLVQLYYYVPRPRPPWRSALWGAATGAVLFEAAKRGFALYATYLADFDRYAAEGPEAGALGRARRRVRAPACVRVLGLLLGPHPHRRRERREAPRAPDPGRGSRGSASSGRRWARPGVTAATAPPRSPARAGRGTAVSDAPPAGDGAAADALGDPPPVTRPEPSS